MIRYLIILFICGLFPTLAFCQDSCYIKIHFLYGSKPRSEYKSIEADWFGGKYGGHVGIECSEGEILNFLPSGDFHWFEKEDEIHGRFTVHSPKGFYSIFSSSDDSIKKTIIVIPVSLYQKNIFDSISELYLQQSPYDYAFFGMRCGAAAYDILSKMEIVAPLSHNKNWRKIFYPKKLRKDLLEKAEDNNWEVIRVEGSSKRKWEND